MLNTDVLHNIFVENVMHVLVFFRIQVQKNSVYFCDIRNVFTGTFDQCNASLMNKSIHIINQLKCIFLLSMTLNCKMIRI